LFLIKFMSLLDDLNHPVSIFQLVQMINKPAVVFKN